MCKGRRGKRLGDRNNRTRMLEWGLVYTLVLQGVKWGGSWGLLWCMGVPAALLTQPVTLALSSTPIAEVGTMVRGEKETPI